MFFSKKSKKADVIVPRTLIVMIIATGFLLVTVNIFANMVDLNPRTAEDLNEVVDTLEFLNSGSSRTAILHNMEPRRDYLVFMNSAEDFNLSLSRKGLFGERNGPTIRFSPSGCQVGEPCVCIFRGVDLRDGADGDVIPRSSLCQPLPYRFVSGPIPVMTAFADEKLDVISNYDRDDIVRVTENIEKDPSDLDLQSAARTFAIAGGAAAIGTAVKVGAVTLLVSGGAVVAAPVLLAGIAGVVVHEALLGFTGDNYDGVFVNKEDVVIYTNPNPDVRFIRIFMERYDDFFVTCPMIEYCNQLVLHEIRENYGGTSDTIPDNFGTTVEDYIRN